MPLQNFQYDTIMREYSRRQAQNHRILEEHTAEAYGKIPRLKEIDDEVATLSADKVRFHPVGVNIVAAGKQFVHGEPHFYIKWCLFGCPKPCHKTGG